MHTPLRRKGKAEYDAYLASRTWRQRRQTWYAAWLTLHGAPPMCLVCDRTWRPSTGHLHHLTYARLGGEHDSDLAPLCARHHEELHLLLDRSAGWRRDGRRQASLETIGLLREAHHTQPRRQGGTAS